MDVEKAFKRFTSIYDESCRKTEFLYREYLMPQVPIELALASKGDIFAASSWKRTIDHNGIKRLPPHGGWSWEQLYDSKRKDTKSYCIAIKSDGELSGLLLGGISKGKNVVSISYLEGAANKTALSSNLVNIAVNLSAFVADNNEIKARYLAVYEPNDRMRERLMNPTLGFSELDLFGYKASSYANCPLYKDIR